MVTWIVQCIRLLDGRQESTSITIKLYAGQTELVCVHNGSDAIVDFKETNKPQQREWISDYFTQGAAYGKAHDTIYGT